MLEQLLIFTRGGLILWTCRELGNALKGSPIDTLIRSCLLQDRSASSSFQYDASGSSYTLKWSFHNELGLVFVAVYQRMLHLLYVDELLLQVKRAFLEIYNPKRNDYRAFDDTFRQLLKEAEARTVEEMRQAKLPPTRSINGGSKKAFGKVDQSARGMVNNANGGKEDSSSDDGDGKGGGGLVENIKVLTNGNSNSNSNGKAKSNGNGKVHPVEEVSAMKKTTQRSGGSDGGTKKPTEAAFNLDMLQKKRSKGGKKAASASASVTNALQEDQGKKKGKQNRVWDDAPASKLDFTDPSEEDSSQVQLVEQGTSLMDKDDDGSDFDEDDAAEELEVSVKGKQQQPKKKGWLSSLIQSVAGKAVIEREDLVPALKVLKDRLMIKNVAEEIAEELCNSVATSLVGKKQGSFSRITSTVQAAMEDALTRILTPQRSLDILRDIQSAKEQGRPYIIVFVGVNGVGKSTNLAKVAYWLLQHEISVMMAACDTFRSGAVEQLRTHARRLQIPIFERGYEKDPAAVAKEAIREATKTNTDVVLVDTAGRMQDNEPLMRALSKLVNVNNPDLVLFVGEALVGNDGVDQLMKFNQKLADLSNSPSSRVIDGILLTKFDTVDDKVGASLSMVYKSGSPIMFVGCGQTYTDLKKLNVKSVVKSLLK